MIPKKIHYCWLGGKPLPPLAEKCLASWKKYCPDYEIILWNEDNYDFTKHPYMKQAFEEKKWGFVPDYARLDIIYQHGGIYLDTDVELVKNLDPLLEYDFYAGFESEKFVNLGLGFGAVSRHPVLKAMMEDYDNYSFIKDDGSLNLMPSPVIQTRFLQSFYDLKTNYNSIQTLRNAVTVLPSEFLAPKDCISKKLTVTSNTFSIHHYDGSWVPVRMKIFSYLRYKSERFLGNKITNFLVKCKRLIWKPYE